VCVCGVPLGCGSVSSDNCNCGSEDVEVPRRRRVMKSEHRNINELPRSRRVLGAPNLESLWRPITTAQMETPVPTDLGDAVASHCRKWTLTSYTTDDDGLDGPVNRDVEEQYDATLDRAIADAEIKLRSQRLVLEEVAPIQRGELRYSYARNYRMQNPHNRL
jgi:hypothetical protein